MNTNNNNLSPTNDGGVTPTNPSKNNTKDHRRANSDAGPKKINVRTVKPARSHENLAHPRKQAWQHQKYNEYKLNPYEPKIGLYKTQDYKSNYEYKGQKEYKRQPEYKLNEWNFYMIKGGGSDDAAREEKKRQARERMKREEEQRKREEEEKKKAKTHRRASSAGPPGKINM